MPRHSRLPGASAHLSALPLPRAAALLLWAVQVLHARIGPDELAPLVGGQESFGADGERSSADGAGPSADGIAPSADEDPRLVHLDEWVMQLRRLPAAQVHLLLPRPGRIAGLVGPPPAVRAALASEQALLVSVAGIADHTLVPAIPERLSPEQPLAVQWMRYRAPLGAHVPPLVRGGNAREAFLRALQRAARTSIDLDLVPDEPVPVDLIPEEWVDCPAPDLLPASILHILELASRTALLARTELSTGSAHTVSAAQSQQRHRILQELEEAALAAIISVIEDHAAQAMEALPPR